MRGHAHPGNLAGSNGSAVRSESRLFVAPDAILHTDRRIRYMVGVVKRISSEDAADQPTDGGPKMAYATQ